MKFCLCVVNVAIDLSHLPQIPAAATDPSCASTSSANILIGIGCPHALPSCANLHSPALAAPPPTISRGFFPWRLSDAGLGASRTAAVRRHPKLNKSRHPAFMSTRPGIRSTVGANALAGFCRYFTTTERFARSLHIGTRPLQCPPPPAAPPLLGLPVSRMKMPASTSTTPTTAKVSLKPITSACCLTELPSAMIAC